ncbi:ATP-binding protein [Lentimicrobium sp.]|uniref:PAS domain-containing hybrid sensor histidine kinase/response regulator n=1 Tax=Lentimicrobium sp. TaxID=2034841 RepID=UPI002BE2868D|nr:ATP-binding protein [Lentimicrobium sp.]HPJ62471.1 ATP-binding protein [Lentimicrobium sp.]
MVSNWFEYEDVSRDELKLNEQFNWVDYYPSPALITDKFWTILRANPPFLSLSGYSESKITGRNIALLINPDSIVPIGSLNGSEQGLCHLKTASEAEIACTIAKKTINLGNEPHRIVSLTPLIKDQGIATVSVAPPSALLEETQAALRENQMRLQQVQQLSEIGTWDVTYGPEPAIRTWNFFELLGIDNTGDKSTPENLNHFGLIHPADLEKHKNLLNTVRSQNLNTYSNDYRIVDKTGKVRFIHCESQLEYNSQGELCRWSGTIQDISSYKKAESLKASAFQISQLIHSQHNLTPLMEAIHQIIASHMPSPNLMIALTNGEEGKLHFPYCVDPEGIPDPESALGGLIGYVLRTGEPLLVSVPAIELMISEKIISGSSRIPQSWLGVPLKTHEKVLGVLSLQSYSSDITYGEDEKNILIFVSEQIALSIQRIRSDEALINAKNVAEDSSRLKSSLLANMSHELRTPMTGILGFSEILTEELEDARMKSMASTIFKSASRLMSTLNSIIDLSAIEADKHTLNLKPVNTRLLFNPLLKVAHSIASDKGLYLRTSLPPHLHVMADEKLLGQMIHHLLDNALKFTIDGGISVSAYTLDKASTEVIIRISDTGIGIAPEHHKMIFEEFRQVSEGFSRTFEGSGLGLSLCAKIARLLNAKIWVESVQEKGSDFYVALPLTLPDIQEPALDTETAEIIRTHRLSRGPIPDVLIVEDNEVNRRLAALYLREICNTEMAENGYVAIEKIKRKKYDAILMDINLGAGPDGLSIAHQVKNFEINKSTPIIAVTGYTMHGDREKLLSNGCSHYLPKPYDKKTLLRLFSGILYGSQTS